MSIQMFLEDHRYFPVIVCDICDERIVGQNDGNFYWELDFDAEDGLQGGIGFAHKTCNHGYEIRFGRWRNRETGKREATYRNAKGELVKVEPPESPYPCGVGSNDTEKFVLHLLANSGGIGFVE